MITIHRLGLVALVACSGAVAAPTVNPLENGSVSVDVDGCSVLFDRHGSIVTQSRDCSSSDVRHAREAYHTFHREENAADVHHGHGSGEYREITGSDGNLGLRAAPDKDARLVVGGLRNGDRVRVRECAKHHGNRWCRVEYRGEVGWVGEQRLGATRDGWHGGGGGSSRDDWEIRAAGDGVPLRAAPDKDAKALVRGLRNGDRVRLLECEKHHGNQWCRVEYRGEAGWIGQQRLQRVR